MDSDVLCDIWYSLCSLKVVPQISFQMHRLHCERNTVECPNCRLRLPKQELNHHISTTHTLRPCPFCSLQFEIRFLQVHRCPKRPKVCEYCAGYFPKDQISEHKSQCGSRTEQCERCFQYIRLSEFENHTNLADCREILVKLKEIEQEKVKKKEKEVKLKQKSKTIAYLEERKEMGRIKRMELDRKKGITK